MAPCARVRQVRWATTRQADKLCQCQWQCDLMSLRGQSAQSRELIENKEWEKRFFSFQSRQHTEKKITYNQPTKTENEVQTVRRTGRQIVAGRRRLAQTPILGGLRSPEGTLFRPGLVESILVRSMPFHKRTYSPGQLPFITTSTYRRAPLFLSERFCRCFVQRLGGVRQE